MNIGFDLISDLNLSENDDFNWENKPTSLYCLIAGNISSDIKTVEKTLKHLSSVYYGVFYVPGTLEFSAIMDYRRRNNEISRMCKRLNNVAFLHHHVVIVDGIAILGCTGYYGTENIEEFETLHKVNMFDDLVYLKNSIERLQKHLDVKKILILTNTIPNQFLYFGKVPNDIITIPELSMTLFSDSEAKVECWAYGSYTDIVDTKIANINYVCNPGNGRNPYWAKRIDIEI